MIAPLLSPPRHPPLVAMDFKAGTARRYVVRPMGGFDRIESRFDVTATAWAEPDVLAMLENFRVKGAP